MLLRPTLMLHRIHAITPELLSRYGITALLLDIDNTLTTHGHPQPAAGVLSWLEGMKAQGIELILVSNNTDERVSPFAQALGLPFVAGAAKPLTKGLREALERLGCPKHKAALVGDQLFTDILGGNLFGIKTILLEPIQPEGGFFFTFKRRLEKPILRGLRRKF